MKIENTTGDLQPIDPKVDKAKIMPGETKLTNFCHFACYPKGCVATKQV